MESDDFELVTLDKDDGTKARVQALSRSSIRRVLGRIIAQALNAGVDLKHWICSTEVFNLYAKLGRHSMS